MANTYYDMYTSQKGSGLAYYQGMRYQKGHGFFGRIFKSTLLPILKYFGKQALDTGADIVKDSLSGQDIKTSVKRRVKNKAEEVLADAMKNLKSNQSGQGKRKRSLASKKKPKTNISRRKSTKKSSSAKSKSKVKPRISNLKKSLLQYAKENL